MLEVSDMRTALERAIQPYHGRVSAVDLAHAYVTFPSVLQAARFAHDTGTDHLIEMTEVRTSFIGRCDVIVILPAFAQRIGLDKGERYASALSQVPGATVHGPYSYAEGSNSPAGAFSLQVDFPNGYSLSVARNSMTYGGECVALLRHGSLMDAAPDGLGLNPWNDTRVSGPADAEGFAHKVAALPAL